MRYGFRPRSRTFRAVLGLALVAWGLFTAVAFARPLSMRTMPAAAMAVSVGGAHCMVASMQHAAAHPVQPTGHACCHGGCHCLGSCGAAITVLHVAMVLPALLASAGILVTPAPAQQHAAPPLRPPIA